MPPLIIAHRGASAYEPENTLRAFELAVRQGAQMIELDLHATRDNQVIVIHDFTLDHTTNLKGRVSELTLAEIKQADAGKGEHVPTLEETLDLMLGKVRLYLEIKDPRAAAETLRTIRARRCQDDVMLASFDIDLMRRLGEEVRDIELGVILGNETLNPVVRFREAFPWIALRGINYQTLCMQVELCFGYLARRVKASGKKLYVWTANNERQFARMTRLGVDGIVTNYPDRLRDYSSRRG
ncbi:MAG TPA: glycerophosphodiester phosphodiesterase family protein [Blastocatellia bacterium]|nr:glycerophosphodiester phosphodiesterase family protein [Blastocatellia bacterium]HMY73757.1 glycerophosphodiester phosphodiesterase family protein [Blastocatellia bacterium]